MRNINGRDFVRDLLSQNPYLSQEDLSERIFSADRRSYPYWVVLIFVATVRYLFIAGSLVAAAIGHLLEQGETFDSVFEAVIAGICESYSAILIDLVFVVIGCLIYRSNPKSMSIIQLLHSTSWSRCRPRALDFLFWSMFPYMLIILAAMFSNL